jgi:hypothetical protein
VTLWIIQSSNFIFFNFFKCYCAEHCGITGDMPWNGIQEKTNQVLKDELKQCSSRLKKLKVFLVIIGSKRKIYDYNHIKDKVMRIKLGFSRGDCIDG